MVALNTKLQKLNRTVKACLTFYYIKIQRLNAINETYLTDVRTCLNEPPVPIGLRAVLAVMVKI
jgi:hypothetical protein